MRAFVRRVDAGRYPAESYRDTRRMKGQHIKEAAVALKDAEKPPYEPTAMEAEAIAAYRVVKATRGPRIKVSMSTTIIRMHSRARWP